MIYKQILDDRLSGLGLGGMRFPLVEGSDGVIDEAETAKLFAWAIEHGVNYFDTAWPYHKGKSEEVIGRILRQYPRDAYRIATKLPSFELAHFEQSESIFEQQLERTGMEYFDYYLLHDVCEVNIDNFLSEQYGILPMLLRKKAEGKIRHLGFSTHGSLETMERFLQACGEYMEFCMIQLNWLDWTLQDARGKVDLLKRHGLPIWVMEPVRGGKLVSLAPEEEQQLHAFQPDASIASFGFRWFHDLDNITMVLSGMSNMAQMRDNIATFDHLAPLAEGEKAVLLAAAERMKDAIPCTACRYCCDGCPMGLNIPDLLHKYNQLRVGSGSSVKMQLDALPAEKWPAACVACGACAAVCPQKIDIPGQLSAFAAALEKIPSWVQICRERAEAERLERASRGQ